jgi:hypothetical protein
MTDLTNITKNFGHIKALYNNVLSESVMSKNNDKKNLFKNYLRTLKENEILKTQFLVYSNIENKVEPNVAKATMFIKESIELFSKYDKKDILESNKKLVLELLFEGEIENDKAELHESISTLIFTERTPNNIDTIVEAMDKVVNYVVNNEPKAVNEAIELPTSMMTSMMVEKYNEKYSVLDESQRSVLKVLIESTEEEKKNVYKNILTECLGFINEKLETSDLETKEKLFKVKEKLLNDKQEVNEDFIKNVSKLIELRDGLKD